MSTKFEGITDIAFSFCIEFIGTLILLLVIFANVMPDSAYRKLLSFGKSIYGGGFIITGLTLVLLLYSSVFIYSLTGISAGHMFPLITIPSMFFGLGILSVSIIKGCVLLLAQFIAAFLAWICIFGMVKVGRFKK